MTQQSWSPLNIKGCGKREQDGRGAGGHGVHLSPWIHQEYTFRHRSACRMPAESGQEYLTSGKEYMLCYAKSLQSCPTLCDPRDSSPPGSSVPGILQARTLEWVAISFSNACMHAKSLQVWDLYKTVAPGVSHSHISLHPAHSNSSK